MILTKKQPSSRFFIGLHKRLTEA